ncbi:hypothetical protein, conserved [Leishmania tarentolae]|uniref:Uncharacterized protein n=1 Tax=Leishmania tarentolae TaxID=5689 RepID=A0A640KHI5_LEITA|nr:hypothetical protein, conserved [Leishmania tarentolae]
MFGGPYRPRVVPVPASGNPRLTEKATNSAVGDSGAYPVLRCPTSSTWNRIQGLGASSADGPQTSPLCSIPWKRLYGTSTYRSPPGCRYHPDEIPLSSSVAEQQQLGSLSLPVVEAGLSTAGSRRYQQLAAQHLYGAATSTPTGVLEPNPITPAASSFGAAVKMVPSSKLRYTDPQGRPLPSAHNTESLLHEPKRSSATGGPVSDRLTVGSSGHRRISMEECSKASELSARSTVSVTAGTTFHLSSVQGGGDVEPTPSLSSTAAPPSNAAVAGTDDRARSCGGATRRELQRQLQRQRSRSLSSRAMAPATSTKGKHLSQQRTAHWAVKLIEDFVAQVAVQQESAATARSRDATTTTTVANLTATFLSSRYGVLQWRPILHEFSACLHRYRLISPTCAVFLEYISHTDAETLADFYLFCRLYSAGDIQHCSVVETRRVALTTATTAEANTIVSRRYVDKREVGDRLQRMLQCVVLIDCALCIAVEADGDLTKPRPLRVRAKNCHAHKSPTHTTWVPQRRHLSVDEVRKVKTAVLGWVEEATHKDTSERSGGAAGLYGEENTEDDVSREAAGVDLQRMSFDREGWVDAYALLQAVLEAVKLVCCSRYPSPEVRDEGAGHVDDGDGGVEEIENVSGCSQRLQPQDRKVTTNPRSSSLLLAQVPPASQVYAYPLEKVDLSPSQTQHRSSMQRPTRPEGDDGDRAGARFMAQTRQDSTYVQPRISVSPHVSAASALGDKVLLSPPCHNVVPPHHSSSISPSNSLRLPPPPGPRTSSLSPCRRVATVKEYPWNSPSGEAQQCGEHNGERDMKESWPRSSREGLYLHHHSCEAQLHGNQLWKEAQQAAAAASQRRDSCWRDHYPRIYSRVQCTPSPRKPSKGACATHTTFASSSSPVDATISSIDTALSRRQEHGCRCDAIEQPHMTTNSADLSSCVCAVPKALFVTNMQDVRCGARPADGLPLPESFSSADPPTSTVMYPSRIHPAAVRSSGSAAPVAGVIRTDRRTSSSPSLATLSPCARPSPKTSELAIVSAMPHTCHEGAAAVTSNTVWLTDEERAMLHQLEIALNQLDTQHRRNHASATSASGAISARKAHT